MKGDGAMNRTMKAKNDQRKKLERQAKKLKFYDVASHRYYASELPKSAEWFAKIDATQHSKMWWEV